MTNLILDEDLAITIIDTAKLENKTINQLLNDLLCNYLEEKYDKYWGKLAMQAKQEGSFKGNALQELLNIAQQKGIDLNDFYWGIKALESEKQPSIDNGLEFLNQVFKDKGIKIDFF